MVHRPRRVGLNADPPVYEHDGSKWWRFATGDELTSAINNTNAAVANLVSNLMPKSGGAFTGPITGTTATFTSGVLGSQAAAGKTGGVTVNGQQIGGYGPGAVAVGKYAAAEGIRLLGVGVRLRRSKERQRVDASAFGHQTQSDASGINSAAFGNSAQKDASGTGSAAFGAIAQQQASGDYSTACGYSAQTFASGDNSAAFGANAQSPMLADIATSAPGTPLCRWRPGGTTASTASVSPSTARRSPQAHSGSVYTGTGTEASITATSGLRIRPYPPDNLANTTALGANSYTTFAGGIAIGQGAAAETPGEVQIGVKTGAEAPTALRVGADRWCP